MSRRKMLAALWAKAQDKSGTRQPDEDERAAANELEDLYILLRECEVCVEQLPASVQGAIQRYYDEAAAFEETDD